MLTWKDVGIIIDVLPFGESQSIVTLFTLDKGRCAGVLPGGRSKKYRSIQRGNVVSAQWSARLEDQLGRFQLEILHDLGPKILFNRLSLNIVLVMCGLLRITLPERMPYPLLYACVQQVLERIEQEGVPSYLKFEQVFLKEMGFGLMLDVCAVTGEKEGLAWVSPKTGRAVTQQAGAPYADRLIPLPVFFSTGHLSKNDIVPSMNVTGYFLKKHFQDVPKFEHWWHQRMDLEKVMHDYHPGP